MKFRWETEFKETEIGEIPEIPRDWEIIELKKFITNIIKGKTPKKIDGEIPYLSAKYLRGEDDPEGYYDVSAGIYVENGEIIILWDGSNSGEVFKAKRGLLASTMCKLEINDTKINKDYLYIVLKSQEEEIKSAKSGTDDRHVDKDYFLEIPVPFPPLSEQSRIAQVLSYFDDLIENKKKQNEILEKTAMAIFKNWFIDFEPFKDQEFVYNEELGKEIPKGWEVKPIGELGDISDGVAYKYEELSNEGDEEAFLLLTLNNILEGGGFKPEFVFIRKTNFKKSHLINEYDIILANKEQTKDGRLLGSPALVIFPNFYKKNFALFSCNNTKIKVKDKNLTYLVYLDLRLNQSEIAEKFHGGTSVWYLHLKSFKENYLIPIPPSSILQNFHSLVEPLFQKIILNQKQIMTLKKVRDTLLPLLVFGKLRIEEL